MSEEIVVTLRGNRSASVRLPSGGPNCRSSAGRQGELRILAVSAHGPDWVANVDCAGINKGIKSPAIIPGGHPRSLGPLSLGACRVGWMQPASRLGPQTLCHPATYSRWKQPRSCGESVLRTDPATFCGTAISRPSRAALAVLRAYPKTTAAALCGQRISGQQTVLGPALRSLLSCEPRFPRRPRVAAAGRNSGDGPRDDTRGLDSSIPRRSSVPAPARR